MDDNFGPVLVDIDVRLTEAEQLASGTTQSAEQLSTDLRATEARAAALLDGLGLTNPTSIPASAPTPAPPEGARSDVEPLDWGALVAQARERLAQTGRGPDDVFVDALLDPQQRTPIERRFSGDFRVRTHLDRYDFAAIAAAGATAGFIDCFLVRIPQDMPYPLGSGLTQKGSPISKWLQGKSVPHDQAPLSGWAKVAYDRVNLISTGQSIPGSGARTHRYHTLGHDPLLGLVFGVIDILRGSTTGIDRSGSLIYIPGTGPPTTNPLLALVKQAAHLLSDSCTSMGLPAPGWNALGGAQLGSFGNENLTVAQVSRLMYLKGYDLRHFLAQSISVAAAELVLHLYWYVREALDATWAEQVDHEWALADIKHRLDDQHRIRRLGPHPRYEALALGAHIVGAAANAGKIHFMAGNPLAFNYAQWTRFMQAGYSYSKRFFRPAGDMLAAQAWINELAVIDGWPTLDWSARDAPILVVGR